MVVFNCIIWGIVVLQLCSLIASALKDRKETKRFNEMISNNKKFLNRVSRYYDGDELEMYGNKAIYSDGEMIWNSVQGCVGKSTYIEI